jgi:hypothetical protein
MALADGLAVVPSGLTTALTLGLGSGFAFAGALLTRAEVGAVETGTDEGLVLLLARSALADFAAVLLLLALAGMLTLLLDFVLAITKAHQKGLVPAGWVNKSLLSQEKC